MRSNQTWCDKILWQLSSSGCSLQEQWVFWRYIIINFRAFQSKTSKTRNWIAFIHCWLILEDVPRWAKTKEESKIWPTPTKKKAPIESMNLVESMEETVKISEASTNGEFGGKAKVLKWPQGSQATKKDQKIKSKKNVHSKHKQEPLPTWHELCSKKLR